MVETVPLIMVNYNNEEYLARCLSSVEEMDKPCKRNNIEVNVIIVDNNSKDTSFRIINNFIDKNDSGSNIKFEAIWAHSNLGFNLSNNLGIKHALRCKNVKYVATLNPDTLVSPEWISTLYNYAEKKSNEERIGMFASEIYVLDIKNKDKWCKTKRKFNFGHSYHDDGVCFDIGLNDNDFTKRASPDEIFCHCYAGSLLARRMFEECGFTDDDYWMFYSCPNLGWKARLKGWNAELVPDSIMWHRQADTRKKPHIRNIVERNRILTILRFMPIEKQPLAIELYLRQHRKDGLTYQEKIAAVNEAHEMYSGQYSADEKIRNEVYTKHCIPRYRIKEIEEQN